MMYGKVKRTYILNLGFSSLSTTCVITHLKKSELKYSPSSSKVGGLRNNLLLMSNHTRSYKEKTIVESFIILVVVC